jgi:hypothetical protein
MNKEWVHLVATIFWGTFGLAVGSLAVVSNTFNIYVMVALIVAITGNSAHLISMSYNKGNLQVEASK